MGLVEGVFDKKSQVWNTFSENGSKPPKGDPTFYAGSTCEVIAKARFIGEEGSYQYIQDVNLWESNYLGSHAEENAIRHIKQIEQKNVTPISVDMIMSFSSCGNCAIEIDEFSKSHPDCPVTLMFSCVFNHRVPHNRAGLRLLNNNRMISLRVFTEREWSLLAEQTGKSDHEYDEDFQRRDSYWKEILDEILNEQSSLPSTSKEGEGDKESGVNREEEDEKEETKESEVIGDGVEAERGGEAEEGKEVEAKEEKDEERNVRKGEKREHEKEEENEEGELQKRSRS